MDMSKEEFVETSWKMSYEEYRKSCCADCNRKDCPHRNSFRRLPQIDGGLGMCLNLQEE